jgi:hypothetical protein
MAEPEGPSWETAEAPVEYVTELRPESRGGSWGRPLRVDAATRERAVKLKAASKTVRDIARPLKVDRRRNTKGEQALAALPDRSLARGLGVDQSSTGESPNRERERSHCSRWVCTRRARTFRIREERSSLSARRIRCSLPLPESSMSAHSRRSDRDQLGSQLRGRRRAHRRPHRRVEDPRAARLRLR